MFDRRVASTACRAAISCGAATRPLDLACCARGWALPLRVCAASMGKKSKRARRGRAGRPRKPSDFGQECFDELTARAEAYCARPAVKELHCQKLLQGRAKAPAPPASDEASEDEDEDADADETFSREQRRARKHPERFTRDQLEALNLLPPAAERISVALAVAKAAAKAVPAKLGQFSPEGARFGKAINALMDAIVTDEDDGADFDEYVRSVPCKASKVTVARGGTKYNYPLTVEEATVTKIAAWPRLRKYWPRLRRRICSCCGKGNLDLSEPRLLVCAGCGEGRGVARYCSEACQREHWPEHQKNCMKFHEYTGNAHQFVETKMHRKGLQNYYNENRAAGRIVTPDLILSAALKMELRGKMIKVE